MKRIVKNTLELSLQDILDKFKIKNASNVKVVIESKSLPNNSDDGSGTELPLDSVLSFSFDVVSAKKKGGGRKKTANSGEKAANGTTSAPAAVA